MIIDDLFRKVLIEPAEAGADTLYVVSGYATAPMVDRHLQELRDAGKRISLKLIIGMTPASGIPESSHDSFVHLMGDVYHDRFECSYLQKTPSTHSKMYAWFRGADPQIGYVGSANYTQRAFFLGQKEAMEESDPARIREYYNQLSPLSCFCTHDDAGNMINADSDSHSGEVGAVSRSRESVKVSLLATKGDMHNPGGGLNWGQREGREPNQGYIPVKARVYHSGFFPAQGTYFTVHTDDGYNFIAARHQVGGKGIQSTQNNSIVGEYFRRRIGRKIGANLLGQFVTKDHLLAYGRTDVDFTKIDDENFHMDFSIPSGNTR